MSQSDIAGTGGCLCGAIRYRLLTEPRGVLLCHCKQCRRSHGHFAAYTAVPNDKLVVDNEESIQWYQSSNAAQRGFCRICGSNLFWRPAAHDYTSVAAGTLDEPTGLRLEAQIFVDDAGDYYALPTDTPAFPATRGVQAKPNSDVP